MTTWTLRGKTMREGIRFKIMSLMIATAVCGLLLGGTEFLRRYLTVIPPAPRLAYPMPTPPKCPEWPWQMRSSIPGGNLFTNMDDVAKGIHRPRTKFVPTLHFDSDGRPYYPPVIDYPARRRDSPP